MTTLEQFLGGFVISAISLAGGLWAAGRKKVDIDACGKLRSQCGKECQSCKAHFCEELQAVQAGQGALMNYARYELGKKGLHLEEINEILEPKVKVK